MEEGAQRGTRRIVLTGGPGGGKTTASDLFVREIGEAVAVVPEAATLLFSAGLPHTQDPPVLRQVQRAIYHLQQDLEDVHQAMHPSRILLCDRGSVDGAAYWPDGPEDFFTSMHTSLEAQLGRYDAVVFFESAAAGGMNIAGNNPTRTEGLERAVELDRRLRALWCQHPSFTLIPHNPSFFKKIALGLAAMERLVIELRGGGA